MGKNKEEVTNLKNTIKQVKGRKNEVAHEAHAMRQNLEHLTRERDMLLEKNNKLEQEIVTSNLFPYILRAGKTRAVPHIPTFNKTNEVEKVVSFARTTINDPAEPDQINKLFGIGTRLNPHKGSARFGFMITGDQVTIYAYHYDGKSPRAEEVIHTGHKDNPIKLKLVIKDDYVDHLVAYYYVNDQLMTALPLPPSYLKYNLGIFMADSPKLEEDTLIMMTKPVVPIKINLIQWTIIMVAFFLIGAALVSLNAVLGWAIVIPVMLATIGYVGYYNYQMFNHERLYDKYRSEREA